MILLSLVLLLLASGLLLLLSLSLLVVVGVFVVATVVLIVFSLIHPIEEIDDRFTRVLLSNHVLLVLNTSASHTPTTQNTTAGTITTSTTSINIGAPTNATGTTTSPTDRSTDLRRYPRRNDTLSLAS